MENRARRNEVYAKEVDGDVGMPDACDDHCRTNAGRSLVNFHPHFYELAPDGVFSESGYIRPSSVHRFVHIAYASQVRAVEIWQEKVFKLLLDESRIDYEVVAMI